MATRRDSLDLSVDRLSEVPLATQLAWKLRTAVATGSLSPGARLPGVREVAEAAGVNVNTARSVYRRLEEDGLISSQHGRGTFVADDAVPSESLAQIAAVAAEEARRRGIDPRDVAAALFVGPATGAEPPARLGDEDPRTGSPGGAGRAHRRDLREEIAALEGELAYLEGLTPGPTTVRTGSAAARMPDVQELLAARDELRERVRSLREERARARAAARRARETAAESDQAAAAEATRPEPARPSRPPDARVWRHGGVWTGSGPGGVVYES